MARVLGVGTGLFVLCFLWTLCAFVALLLSRAKGPASYGSIGILALAGIITAILTVLPREPQFPDEEEEIPVIYDYTIVYRSCLLAGSAAFLLVGFFAFVTDHLAQPIHAKPLRKIR